MASSTKKSNRKQIPKILPLAIEKILSLYTDAGKKRYLSIREIRDHLSQDFQIEVSDDSVRRTLLEMQSWYENQMDPFEVSCNQQAETKRYDQTDASDQGKNTLVEIGVIHPFTLEITEHKGNEKQRYALRRTADSDELAQGLSHIVRQIRVRNPKTEEKEVIITDVERWAVSVLDLDAQKKILSMGGIANGGGHSDTMRLEFILGNLDKISRAIERGNYITFSYDRDTTSPGGAPAEKSEYLPLYIHFDGDHYYLAAKNRVRSIMRKDRSGEKVFSPRILRIDRMKKISYVLSDNPAHKKDYAVYPNTDVFDDMKAEAKKLMEAGVGGVFSGKIIQARVKCHNKSKAIFARNTFAHHAGFSEVTMQGAPRPEFIFSVSRDGFIRWARQWSDVVEVIEPASVRESIIKELSHNVYFNIDMG